MCRPCVPALAIPTKGKAFECPELHQLHLESLLPHVRSVLTVGWRAGEEHFIKLLKERVRQPVRVVCVGKDGTDSNYMATKLRRTFTNCSVTPFGGGFTNFMIEEAYRELLSHAWPK